MIFIFFSSNVFKKMHYVPESPIQIWEITLVLFSGRYFVLCLSLHVDMTGEDGSVIFTIHFLINCNIFAVEGHVLKKRPKMKPEVFTKK